MDARVIPSRADHRQMHQGAIIMIASISFIASCLIGAAIIETRAHCFKRKIIHLRIAALIADADRAKRRAEQAKSCNHNPSKIHRSFSFGKRA
jgi:hypothetical protein